MQQPQLFLLHFAGGNCYSFQFMAPLLTNFVLTPLELPGRGRRMREKLLKDFDEAALDLYHQINTKLTSSPFLIYGHSMGAYLGLRVTNMLEKAGKFPAYLIVSGNAGPGIEKDRPTHSLNRSDFITELKSLGGISPEILGNDEWFDFFEPILRADMEIAEKKELAGEPAVNVPLYALMGSRESKVDKISNWGRYTHSNFNYEVLEGGHFFIQQHPERIAAILNDCYKKAVLLQQL